MKRNFARLLKRPDAFQRAVARSYFQVQNSTAYNDDGIDIFDEDWDNLLILDACRADVFQGQVDIQGTFSSRTSRGSSTKEFIRANFSDKEICDTVYVSSNLWYPKLATEINSEIFEFRAVPEAGNKNYESVDESIVSPSLVTDIAKKANAEFPNKRLIIHYSQPHYPYLGTTGEQYFSVQDSPNLLEAIRRSDQNITPDIVKQAYRENLQLALSEIRDLMPSLTGKTVITADHGELLGERLLPFPSRQYGHPTGIYVDELVTVPWHIIETDTRKEIIPERKKTKSPRYNKEFVDERLSNLGYKM